VVYGFVPENSKEKELANAMQLQSYIDWKGFVEPPEHLEGMKQSDIFVLPSRHEGVANTLMEAIGMGMPIVATKVGGTPELIEDGKNGLLCFVDARDIAEKLRRLILDESLRMSFYQANVLLSKSFYWENICTQYEKLYLSCEIR
jgi:glycosyltransferase involved in cell wall biosynthesis